MRKGTPSRARSRFSRASPPRTIEWSPEAVSVALTGQRFKGVGMDTYFTTFRGVHGHS